MAALLGGRIESLPEPRIHYYPIRSHASDRWMNAFALMGTSKILCSDAGGWAAMYNAEAHSFLSLPELKSPKGPRYVAASIPRTAAADFEIHPDVDSAMFGGRLRGDHTDSLYIMDMVPGQACSFEVLACYPGSRWRWRPLPPPPATYCFDTVAMRWSKAGDWVLPFRSRLEHDAELGMWFGISARRPGELCALDLAAVASGSSCGEPPAVRRVGLDVDPPGNWVLINEALVSLGSGRFCIAKFFDVIVVRSDEDEEGGLSMVNHKTECLLTDDIEWAL
ncbi:hypothetical protein C2845_PM06G34230 [Panicum miliaceum]|uniref:Uncharacterized protein n=1 Tax=Panicum miliaceum TaxID=4540 RepID=A0A3L6R4V6_PANMI|nr:hypothetical protein C2845_PM06G34230 [Panicum miliaceum]